MSDEMSAEDRAVIEAQTVAMHKMVEAQARLADSQEAQARAHAIDYRQRSLDLSIASFQPRADEQTDERIIERAERFWMYLVMQ